MYPSPQGWKLIITLQLMQLIAITAVIGRIITRMRTVRHLGADDMFCVAALIASILLSSDMTFQVANGIGHHVKDVPPENITRIMKAYYGTLIIYYVALTLVKTAIILQYNRFITIARYQHVSWILLGFVVIYGITTEIQSIFACTPIKAFWDFTIPRSHCINLQAAWLANAGLNILTDFLIILFPMPALARLQMPTKKRRSIMCIFAAGGLVIIISILRLYSIHVVAKSVDVTYDNVDAAMWSCLEVQTGIICSCLPCLGPVLSKVFPGLLTSNSSAQQRDGSVKTIGQSGQAKKYKRSPFGSLFSTRNDGMSKLYDSTINQTSNQSKSSDDTIILVTTEVSHEMGTLPQSQGKDLNGQKSHVVAV